MHTQSTTKAESEAQAVAGWRRVMGEGTSEIMYLVPEEGVGSMSHTCKTQYCKYSDIDWIVVLRPTRHKIGHFGDVPEANRISMEKLNLTQQKHTFSHQKKCTTTQSKHKKVKPGLV